MPLLGAPATAATETMSSPSRLPILILLGVTLSSAAGELRHPCPLVLVDDGSLRLNETTLGALGSLPHPIHIVSVVGPARIGKSTWLNLLMTHVSGEAPRIPFQTSGTVESCTQGIWAYTTPAPGGSGSLLVLDVEGNDIGIDRITRSLSVFAAALASVVVAFVDQKLDNHQLEELGILTAYLEKLGGDILLPDLAVVIKDVLRTEGSATEYVHERLTVGSNEGDRLDVVRKALKDAFNSTSAIGLARAADTELAALELNDFNRFLRQRGRLATSVVDGFSRLLSNLRPRLFQKDGRDFHLTGPMLVSVSNGIFGALNKVGKLQMPTLYEQLLRSSCETTRTSLVDRFSASLESTETIHATWSHDHDRFESQLEPLRTQKDDALSVFRHTCPDEREILTASELLSGMLSSHICKAAHAAFLAPILSSPPSFRCGRYYDCDRQLEYPLSSLQGYCPSEPDLLRIRSLLQGHENAAHALQTSAISQVRLAIRTAAKRLHAEMPISLEDLESKFDALLLRQVTEQHAFASSLSFRRAVRDEAEADWEGLALENDRARQAKKQQEQAEAQQQEVLRKLAESEKQKRDMQMEHQREAERRAERATKEALESARRLQEAMERRANEPGFLSGVVFSFMFIVMVGCFILAGKL